MDERRACIPEIVMPKKTDSPRYLPPFVRRLVTLLIAGLVGGLIWWFAAQPATRPPHAEPATTAAVARPPQRRAERPLHDHPVLVVGPTGHGKTSLALSILVTIIEGSARLI